jgi:hypothetical protein
MGTGIVNTDVVEFVKLGDRVSLDYRVEIPNRATLDAVLAVCKEYNFFDPDRVAKTVGEVFDDLAQIVFERDGLDVIMNLMVPIFNIQRYGDTTEREYTSEKPRRATQRFLDKVREYTWEERQAFTQRIIDWAQLVEAHEITVQQLGKRVPPVPNAPGANPFRVRILWD